MQSFTTPLLADSKIDSSESNSKPTIDTVIPINDQKTPDLLEKVAQHYLIDNHPYSSTYKVWATLLGITAFTSPLLYIRPSLAYGQRFNSETLGIEEVIGNVVGAFIVTLNTGKVFMEYVEGKKNAEKKLGEFLHKTNSCRKKSENILIAVGAILSAAPLVAPAVEYSTQDRLGLRILEALVIASGYGFMHTLPVMILAQNKLIQRLLLLPLLPFYCGYKAIERCRMSDELLYDLALAEQKKRDHFQLKAMMVGRLEFVRKTVLDNSFTFDWKQLQYMIKVHEHVKAAVNVPTGFEKYIALLQQANLLPKREPRKWSNWFGNYVNPLLSNVSFFAGSAVVSLGISGFIGSEANQTLELTGSKTAAGFITALPAFITGILTSYFGGKTFQGIYDYVVSWLGNTNEVPLAFRLYPKTVTLLLMLSGLLSWYSSGPAEELVYDNFSGEQWDTLRPVLIGFARYGVQLYSFINMFEIIFTAVTAFGKKYGSDDAKMVIELSQRIQAMEQGIFGLDGDELEKSLQALPEEQRKPLLGIEKEKFEEIIDHKKNLKKTVEGQCCNGRLTRFFEQQRKSSISVQDMRHGQEVRKIAVLAS